MDFLSPSSLVPIPAHPRLTRGSTDSRLFQPCSPVCQCTNRPLPAVDAGVTTGPGEQQETSGKLDILFVKETRAKRWNSMDCMYSRENPGLPRNNRELRFSPQDSDKCGRIEQGSSGLGNAC